MKKLITLIIVASLALTIRAQDITNTLGSSGNFTVNKSDGTTNLFTLSEDEDHTMRFSAGQKGFTIFNEHGNSIFQVDDPYSVDDLGVLKLGKVDDFWLNANTDFPNLLIQNSVKPPNISMVSIATTGSRIGSYSANGTSGAPSAVSDGFGLLGIHGYGHDGTNYKRGASINFTVDGTPATGFVPAKIDFYTGTNSTIPLRRMTIKSDGKVGIGTYTPNSTLNVNGSLALPLTLAFSSRTLNESEYTIIASGTITLTLPDSNGIEGRIYVIKKENDTNKVTIDPGSDHTIDAFEAFTLDKAYQYIIVQAAGPTHWVIIGGN